MSEITPQTNSLYAKIEDLLKSIPELITEEKELRYNKIKEMAENGDATLLIPLLQNDEIKNAFFTPILDSFVFKTKEFKEFLDYSSSNNSYSQYLGKKIGLYCGDSALTDRNEVVLNFPFKDCVLEGGQKKEDGLDTYFEYDEKTGEYVSKESKRREIFFNEILAKDEIDNLFSPKAFCNVKKFSADGEASCVDFTRDVEVNKNRGLSEDTITDNLIIKGNNLLALHSLKKEFEGKIKLIYIDVPFNTGNDDFAYNDNFNHSSWLTFMKNRLEVAKELLRDDGTIFVHCDNNEEAYLKVLMDSIFSFFVNVITVKSSTPSGVKTSHAKKTILKSQDFILVYKKQENILFKPQYYKKNKWDTHYMFFIDEKHNKLLKLIDILRERNILTEEQTLEDFDINNRLHKNFYKENGDYIVRKSTHENKQIKENCNNKINKDNLYYHKDNGYYYLNNDMLQPISKSFHDFLDGLTLKNDISNVCCDFWDDIDFQNTQNQGGISFPAGKKPEQLIYRIIDMASVENDIVLDYHLGSGTTAAVAHKMNRQYIGVEQMDYIKTISCERLKKVIEGEQGGISKSVEWQGGGSFVYMELAEKNERALQLISACKNYDELVSIFNTLSTKYFLHYNVRINDFINKTCKEEQFKNLSLEKQKEIFCRMLDLNQLYVNCDDRNDKDSGLSENDIKATENFYQIQKDGE